MFLVVGWGGQCGRALCWGDHPALFGWIIKYGLVRWEGTRERGGQVESRLQKVGAGSENRGRGRVRVAGGTRPGAGFAGQAR